MDIEIISTNIFCAQSDRLKAEIKEKQAELTNSKGVIFHLTMLAYVFLRTHLSPSIGKFYFEYRKNRPKFSKHRTKFGYTGNFAHYFALSQVST